ncbi:MAG: leucine--tRNA ligase [bacterium]|nr:leucine--tRNA ligase [bacterium]
MEYNPKNIEKKWQQYWTENKIYKVEIDHSKPKYYVLDMFPYPSGAGLHVGHPLGYIASDIFARYKRLKGFNVLHPMGYDSFGLPAEQYAIQTGTHPSVITQKNIDRYRQQLDRIGFSFDWEREVRTSDSKYYKWTQWTFILLFNSWYNKKIEKAESIDNLIKIFEQEGTSNVYAAVDLELSFSSKDWRQYSEKRKQKILMSYRLSYLAEASVNWCPELGTVLANDEVVNGLSERGGYPVIQKKMKQWFLRVSAYAERLLDGLRELHWSNSIKEIQRNWIGKSEGCMIHFSVDLSDRTISVFTTRADTIGGVTFLVLAPEYEKLNELITDQQNQAVQDYILWTSSKTERDRISDTKKATGVFTGSFAVNPFNNSRIPIYIADYVLGGYGTGAIMAVPAHDSRDFLFARHFDLPILQVVCKELNVIKTNVNQWEDSYDSKDGYLINSGFLDGKSVNDAILLAMSYLEQNNLGKKQVNYKLRDAIFSRQRYWGEPFPIYYKDSIPYTLELNELPLLLPDIDKYLPTKNGNPPLARAINWVTIDNLNLETNTMPGFAGSCGYYLRYMDPHNEKDFLSKNANEYWRNVDLYLGGDEHATGHLIYARFWNMFLFDMGLVCEAEPFKRLVNQGKILGRSSFVYRLKDGNTFVSYHLIDKYSVTRLHVDVSLVTNDILDIEGFKNWRTEFKDAKFILEQGTYFCGWEIEKMSKSKHNVVNPDELIDRYGADTFRLYEMFLGPLENHKPWDTNGIEGVSRFIKKFWRLFFDNTGKCHVSSIKPTDRELKILHQTINKVEKDILNFSFNTAVSQLMICVNSLIDLRCKKREVLEKLLVLLSPFAPHISEELWRILGNKNSIVFSSFPIYDPHHLINETYNYPVSFDGKTRFTLEIESVATEKVIEQLVLNDRRTKNLLGDKNPTKIYVIKNKIVNIVL